MTSHEWLIKNPIAHRGLHSINSGIVENSLNAAKHAIDKGYSIECDLRITSDNDLMVFHDKNISRLTGVDGIVSELKSDQLRKINLIGSSETIPNFAEFLDIVQGKVPLICEIKSDFDGNNRAAQVALDIAALYSGPLAFKSFDPQIIEYLRNTKTKYPLGVVGESHYTNIYWDRISTEMKFNMINFNHYNQTQPDFISWKLKDLMHSTPYLWKKLSNRPLLSWTIETIDDFRFAIENSDQIIFEKFAVII
jgi:hypothetical protein